MSGTYAYTPQIWPPILMAVLMVTVSVYSGRRRNVPGATALMFASLLAAAWAAGSFLEYAAVDLPTRITWFKVQAAVQVPIVIAITCFIMEYAWPGRWLTRRNLALLALPGLLAVVMILTDDLHHLVWRGLSFADGSVKVQFGPSSWILLAYSFGVLGLVNLVVFGWLFRRSVQHRWPVVIMLAGQLAGRMIFLVDRAHLVQSFLPLDLLGMSLEFLLYAIVLFGFRILDPIPLARRTAIEQLHSGMLVLDIRGNIVSLNPAAAVIMGSPMKNLLGRSIQELLPAGLEPAGDLQATLEAEISLGDGPEDCVYQLEASALNDWRGLAVGRLLLLHDVTAQKRAQAQILEQQRALAILTERERLAHELHDDLGQVLAFISMQGHVIQQLLVRGDITTAASYVARLVEAGDEADVAVRESILSLRAPFNRQGLIPALKDYLRRYEDRYGLHIELFLPEGGLENAFEPVAEVQILRILQEGLTNVRKHASASCVQITFSPDDGRIQIVMQDDGKGFEPDGIEGGKRRGFGLQFMRERAEAIGGNLELRSTPGRGTEVLLAVPLKESNA